MKVSRRRFVSWIGMAWTAFAAALLTAGTATARFMFPNVLFEKSPTFKAGFPDEVRVGEVDTRFKQDDGVWLVRDDGGIYALRAVCTHLGCTPNWLPEAEKFKCPCHGSGYYKSGINFEGPSPRPLERVGISLLPDGQMLIDKSETFRFELGQWSDPASFLKV